GRDIEGRAGRVALIPPLFFLAIPPQGPPSLDLLVGVSFRERSQPVEPGTDHLRPFLVLRLLIEGRLVQFPQCLLKGTIADACLNKVEGLSRVYPSTRGGAKPEEVDRQVAEDHRQEDAHDDLRQPPPPAPRNDDLLILLRGY